MNSEQNLDSKPPAIRWLSTSSWLALVIFLAFAGSMAILLAFLARSTQAELDADARTIINAEVSGITQSFERDGFSGAKELIASQLRVRGPLVFRLESPVGPDGLVRNATGNIAIWPAALPPDGRLRRIMVTRIGDPEASAYAAVATALPGGYRLLVGRSLEEQDRLTRTLNASLLAAIGLSLALAIGFSTFIAQVTARRIQAIANVTGAAAGGDFSKRVPVPAGQPRDAFDSLGASLNTMLAQIETLLEELRTLTDGLAHDLRSPLTRMKARIDHLQRSGDSSEAELAAIGMEADQLLAMLENSLAISRAEAGMGRDQFAPTDIAALARQMVEMYEPLADDNGIRLTIDAPAKVEIRANRAMLSRALANLIDNALRYAPNGKTIDVAVRSLDGGARLIVADHGPGILPARRATALRRFGRLDTARSATGAGLGLSLAASIARLHGGTLTLGDNNPGLRVEIDLPAA
jgi:signal transduction histidine kinase